MLLFAASDKPAAALLNPLFCPATTIVDAPAEMTVDGVNDIEPCGPRQGGEDFRILQLWRRS